MTSNSFQFAFWILFNYIYSLNKPETINEIEKIQKANWKEFNVIGWKWRILYLLKGFILRLYVACNALYNNKN